MGLLGEIFSAGDSAKRKLKGLLSDPLGELGLLGARAAEDMQTFLDTGAKAYPMLDPRLKPRLDTPQGREMVVDQNVARQKFGEMAANMGMAAATVWHGSPHKFDRFDSSKIGTGEGAQAYGHGLYLADVPDVAKEYAKLNPAGGALPPPRRFFNGQELEAGSPEYHAATLLSGGKSINSVRKEVSQWIADSKKWPQQRLADPKEQAMLSGWQKTLETLNQAKSKSQFKTSDALGNLYKVDLPDEAIAKMLDWDKEFAKQPKEVKEALKKSGLLKQYRENLSDFSTPMATRNRNMRGENIEAFMQHIAGGQAQAAEQMRQLGIPGIRYLDGGSRGAGTGTRNYVVFPGNEGLLTILERNGVAP